MKFVLETGIEIDKRYNISDGKNIFKDNKFSIEYSSEDKVLRIERNLLASEEKNIANVVENFRARLKLIFRILKSSIKLNNEQFDLISDSGDICDSFELDPKEFNIKSTFVEEKSEMSIKSVFSELLHENMLQVNIIQELFDYITSIKKSKSFEGKITFINQLIYKIREETRNLPLVDIKKVDTMYKEQLNDFINQFDDSLIYAFSEIYPKDMLHKKKDKYKQIEVFVYQMIIDQGIIDKQVILLRFFRNFINHYRQNKVSFSDYRKITFEISFKLASILLMLETHLFKNYNIQDVQVGTIKIDPGIPWNEDE